MKSPSSRLARIYAILIVFAATACVVGAYYWFVLDADGDILVLFPGNCSARRPTPGSRVSLRPSPTNGVLATRTISSTGSTLNITSKRIKAAILAIAVILMAAGCVVAAVYLCRPATLSHVTGGGDEHSIPIANGSGGAPSARLSTGAIISISVVAPSIVIGLLVAACVCNWGKILTVVNRIGTYQVASNDITIDQLKPRVFSDAALTDEHMQNLSGLVDQVNMSLTAKHVELLQGYVPGGTLQFIALGGTTRKLAIQAGKKYNIYELNKLLVAYGGDTLRRNRAFFFPVDDGRIKNVEAGDDLEVHDRDNDYSKIQMVMLTDEMLRSLTSQEQEAVAAMLNRLEKDANN